MAKDITGETIKIGDTIEGTYHKQSFRGVVTSWDFADGGCYVNVRLDAPVTIYGWERGEVYDQDTTSWRIVARRVARPTISCSQWGARET